MKGTLDGNCEYVDGGAKGNREGNGSRKDTKKTQVEIVDKSVFTVNINQELIRNSEEEKVEVPPNEIIFFQTDV